jgi:hypothetical protein
MTDNYRKITDMELGAKMERQRIIKLLIKNSSDLGWIQLDIDELIKVIERKTK